MNVLVADDHPAYRRALIDALLLVDPTLSPVEAGNYPDAEEAIATHAPALALVDLKMKGATAAPSHEDAEHRLRQLKSRFPQTNLVVVSEEEDPPTIRRVLSVGLKGFISKTEEPRVMLQALRLVLDGGIFIPPQATSDFIEGRPPADRPDPTGLTPMQHKVAQHLHLSNKEIAKVLRRGESTVDTHVTAVLQKLNARNRTHAALIYRELMGRDWRPGAGY